MRSNRRTLALAALAFLACATAGAAEIKVLTAGAFKSALLAQVPDFERQTGHKLSVQNDTAGALLKRIRGGEAFDVVVLTQGAIDELARSGEVVAGTAAPVARVGIGVAVKAGAPLPDLSSTAAFRQLLLSARAVAIIDPAAGGTSGIYLMQLFERLGVADQVKPKAVLVPGGYTAERVVNGEAEIAVQQMSELVAVPGAVLAGPLPPEVQNYTVYAGAIGAKAGDGAAAAQFLAALQSAAFRATLIPKGLSTP